MQLDQKRALLILAKKTIEGYLTGGKVPFDKQTVLMLHPEFNIQVARLSRLLSMGGCVGVLDHLRHTVHCLMMWSIMLMLRHLKIDGLSP
jgi:hypothetical protein